MSSLDDAACDPGSATAVEVRRLTLQAGGRVLLEEAQAHFAPGEITLIVGPSGAGKSLLLRTLAGLLDDKPGLAARGEILLDGSEVLASGKAAGRIGVVFQSFALFDELSPLDNVRFALAHRADKRPSGDRRSAEAWLAELGVPSDVRTASLSGGQRQRLAIARTLAYDPPVILYDEPTSGLDAPTAARVARLIQATHTAHRKTSIIVTHDDRSLVPIADRVFLLDTRSRQLREIPREAWDRIGAEVEALQTVIADAPPAPRPPRFSRWLTATLRCLGDFFEGATRFCEQVLLLPLRLVPRMRSPAWGARLFLHYLRLVADPSAWLYIGVAGCIAGFVSTYFTFRFLPYRQFTEPLIEEELLQALGFMTYRIFVPVLATVLIAARCGAAVASDVGGKVYGQQFDALRGFHAPPARYLATNIVYAFLLGTLWLVAIGFLAAEITSLVVFTTTHPHQGPFFWDSNFFRELRAPGQLYKGTGWLVLKLLCCAAGMGVIAYDRGSRPKYSTGDVSAGITSTVLWATLHVLVVHLVFALFEFEEALH